MAFLHAHCIATLTQMSRNTRRTRRPRRHLPPRPTFADAVEGSAEAHESRAVARSREITERESRSLVAEMKRVAFVTVTCTGLLALLVVADRIAS